jgi:hypothetical protein
MSTDAIKKLIEHFLELEQSEKNQARKRKWARLPETGRDQFRAVPKMDRGCRMGDIPVCVDIQNSFWGALLGFDLTRFYFEPEYFLENYLKIRIRHFELLDDDVFLTKNVIIWGTSVFEASMFGMSYTVTPGSDPQILHNPAILSKKEFKRTPQPDFYKSGIMPVMIRIYESVRELSGGLLNPIFPEWVRGPFGIATYLCGYGRFLETMMDDPDYAAEVLNFIEDCRQKWYEGYCAYLGKQLPHVNLFNDEVGVPTLSPALYRDIVLPVEREVCNKHSGLLYWHSCGDVTPMAQDIATLKPLEMMHVGPWTNIRTAARTFGQNSALEICLNPQKDIYDVHDIHAFQRQVTRIIDICAEEGALGITVRASGFMPYQNMEWDLRQICDWTQAARNATNAFASRFKE